ncbi:MAG: TetR/AcrR family transcriptional regulator [Magnetococcales bacterium]|nr:TetR/AcrR family transcriptional regulator [Magnetococcales bacterium]
MAGRKGKNKAKKREKAKGQKLSKSTRQPEFQMAILQALSNLLEQDAQEISLADVAHKLGVSEEGVRYHFSCRKALFRVLAGYMREHLLRPVEQVAAESEDPLRQLGRLWRYQGDFFRNHPGLYRLFLLDPVIPESVRQTVAADVGNYRSRLAAILTSGRDQGAFTHDLPVDAAVNLFVGLLRSHALESGRRTLAAPQSDQAWNELWPLFARAIGA